MRFLITLILFVAAPFWAIPVIVFTDEHYTRFINDKFSPFQKDICTNRPGFNNLIDKKMIEDGMPNLSFIATSTTNHVEVTVGQDQNSPGFLSTLFKKLVDNKTCMLHNDGPPKNYHCFCGDGKETNYVQYFLNI